MNTRFIILTILTSLFQVICVIALVAGLIIAFSDQAPANTSSDLLAQVPEKIKTATGLGLMFYALTGLVFSGGIHVLISINDKAHEANEALTAMLARLKEAPVAARTEHTASRDTVPAAHACPHCGAANDAHSRFCEVCGAAQPAS